MPPALAVLPVPARPRPAPPRPEVAVRSAVRFADGYRREAEWATTLGAAGKWAIHPSQIDIANEVFSPTEAEIARARAVVEAVRAAEAAGEGSANLNGVMIDAATARIFETILERAALTEQR